MVPRKGLPAQLRPDRRCVLPVGREGGCNGTATPETDKRQDSRGATVKMTEQTDLKARLDAAAAEVAKYKAMLDKTLTGAEKLCDLVERLKGFIETELKIAKDVKELPEVKNCNGSGFYILIRSNTDRFIAVATELLRKIKPNPQAGQVPEKETAAAAKAGKSSIENRK